MSEPTVDVLADLRNVESLYGIDLAQSIAAVAALIEREKAQRELLGEILEDLEIGASPQLYADRIRELARGGGAK